MKSIRKQDLRFDDLVAFSWSQAFLGTVLIALWAYGIYWLHGRSSVPGLVLWAQYVCFPIFLWLNLKQYYSLIKGTIAFLLGFRADALLLPLNWYLKSPKKTLNLYLEMRGKDITSMQFVRERRMILKKRSGSGNYGKNSMHQYRVIFSCYLVIDLQEDLPVEIFDLLKKIATQEGSQGGPLFPESSKKIHYYYTDHQSKQAKMHSLLKKYFGGYLKDSILSKKTKLTRNSPKEDILLEARRLIFGGESLVLDQMLEIYSDRLDPVEVKESLCGNSA